MSAFLLVLTIIIGGINIVNYGDVVDEADELLSILSENKGTFPIDPSGKNSHLPPRLSPETPYESRYFTVILNKNTGAVIQTETGRIASVDTGEAIEYAKAALRGSQSTGFLDHYRYMIRQEDSRVQITFLDCGRKLDSFKGFLLTSIGISLMGYVIVFVLISFFSNRIIRPISESYEKQKRFITDAGHEIKTPLAIINADTDVLAMELGENEWLEDIQKQTQRLTSLTNDLVMLSKMEESESSMQMMDFPFSEVVQDTLCSFQSMAQTQNKELRFHVEPLLSLYGNEKAITQLVNILLENALKYSPDSSVVSLTAIKQNRTIRLSVSNATIEPLPKDSIPLLFDRFYRIDPSRNSQTGGNGIGLSVAKAIVMTHKGKISASAVNDSLLEITAVLPIC